MISYFLDILEWVLIQAKLSNEIKNQVRQLLPNQRNVNLKAMFTYMLMKFWCNRQNMEI